MDMNSQKNDKTCGVKTELDPYTIGQIFKSRYQPYISKILSKDDISDNEISWIISYGEDYNIYRLINDHKLTPAHISHLLYRDKYIIIKIMTSKKHKFVRNHEWYIAKYGSMNECLYLVKNFNLMSYTKSLLVKNSFSFITDEILKEKNSKSVLRDIMKYGNEKQKKKAKRQLKKMGVL